MMVVDASAILAITLLEEDALTFKEALAEKRGGVMSAVNYWEALVRMQGLHGSEGLARTDGLLSEARVEIVGADPSSARAAAAAFRGFKARSTGRLNLGDCFAYALAEREGDGLLFKGDDFTNTDVKNALAPDG